MILWEKYSWLSLLLLQYLACIIPQNFKKRKKIYFHALSRAENTLSASPVKSETFPLISKNRSPGCDTRLHPMADL